MFNPSGERVAEPTAIFRIKYPNIEEETPKAYAAGKGWFHLVRVGMFTTSIRSFASSVLALIQPFGWPTTSSITLYLDGTGHQGPMSEVSGLQSYQFSGGALMLHRSMS
jgi:hypothetical protein